MFTGIVTDIGIVKEVAGDSDRSVRISPVNPQPGLEIGASIACDGICLTAVEIAADGSGFTVNVSQETLERTAVGQWRPGRRVNLERSLRVGDELGGHIVTGHVDGVAEILNLESAGESCRAACRAPGALARFLAQKGSVALNGVSLTVNRVSGSEFTVNLIPHTMSVTNWADAAPGDGVNIEIDILARYMARFQDISGQA